MNDDDNTGLTASLSFTQIASRVVELLHIEISYCFCPVYRTKFQCSSNREYKRETRESRTRSNEHERG